MRKLKTLSTILVSSLLTILAGILGLTNNVSAGSFSVSPMNDKISLTPGETYYGSFSIHNPNTETEDFSFYTSISTFSNTGEDGDVQAEVEATNYNKMVDWITVYNGEGTVSPNESWTVNYIINVPDDAPAGGQYATIIIQSTTNDDSVEGAINIQQQFRIAYLIYAEVAGETVHDGEILSADVPSFLLTGNIEGTSLIKNTGNTHTGATYKLQVFPLFSNEEVYTNEEDPDTALIMPEATRLKTTAWENTPSMGIFNVIYTVEFEGITQTVEKMVIVCPIWLLFVIIFGIIFIIFYFFAKSKSRKKAKR